jgi:hypothetical protein
LDSSNNRRVVEALVTRAYFQLVLVAWDDNGSRAALLAKHGDHEVRLIERLPADAAGRPQLWIDLRIRDAEGPIDRRPCGDDLEVAVHVAEHLISQAMQLDEAARSSGGDRGGAPE